jgi:Tol biopolymer transport system component
MAPKRGLGAREATSLATIRPHSQNAAGVGEALSVWALFAVFVGATFWAYARLPARDFFHVSTSGPSGGAGRALVYVNYPVALVSIAIALVAADRLRGRWAGAVAVAAVGLSAVLYFPGVVSQRDLDARWVNAIPALGVALAFALTLAAARGGVTAVRRAPGDRLRVCVGAAVILLGLEYVSGEFGVYVDQVPVLGSIFAAREPWAPFGQANLRPIVHLGHHHGFAGAELALSALVLSRVLGTMRRRRVEAFLALYLAVMLAYGLANEVQDVWGEQLVKRGVVSWAIPSVNEPGATAPFLAVIAAGVLLYLLLFHRLLAPREAVARRIPAVLFAVPLLVGGLLVGLGLGADGSTARTSPAPAAQRAELGREGAIAFAMVDQGWDVFVVRGEGSAPRNLTRDDWRDLGPRWVSRRRLVFQSDRQGNADVYAGGLRLTADGAADGEPAASPDGRLIAFVSTRDGNRELYVMRADGSRKRRVTRNAADDEWPRWTTDGRIVFQSDRDGDYDLYVASVDGAGLRRLTDLRGDERTPAWSHRGSRIVFSANSHGGYDLYEVRADGRGLRRITRLAGDEFAPAWSRDDRFLVFVGNRDGRDQLFAVRADGSGLARLTDVQADKDAPDWR